MRPPTHKPHIAVVYNPSKDGIEKVRKVVEAHSKKAKFAAAKWYETAAVDSGTAAAEQALVEGAHAVLAVGGDGTVRGVAAALRGTNVPLGIVPLGTGNVLARNLGMPLNNLEQQVHAVFHGKNQQMDLGVAHVTRPNGEIDEALFLVLAGMGLDARSIAKTNPKLKAAIGWLAYVDAGLREVVRDNPLVATVQIDEHPQREISVYTLMIGNCGYLPGGSKLIPEAVIDDGALDVIALRPGRGIGPLAWARILRKIVLENTILRRSKAGSRFAELVKNSESVRYRKVHQLRLSVPQPEPLQLDGEDFGLATEFYASVDPAALTVCVGKKWKQPIQVFSRKPV